MPSLPCYPIEPRVRDCDFCGKPVHLTVHGDPSAFGILYRLEPLVKDGDPAYVCESCRYPFECEHCGEMCDKLTAVEDRDDSVGYRDIVNVCDDCLRRKQ